MSVCAKCAQSRLEKAAGDTMSKSDSNPREYKQVLSLDLKDWVEGADLTLQYFTCRYFLTRIIVTVCTELEKSLTLK